MKILLYILLLPLIANAQFPASGGAAAYSSTMSPKWGALINGQHPLTLHRAQIALALKCTHVRMSIKATTWDGNSEAFDVYTAAGLKIILDIDMTEQNVPRRFETNMVAWANFVDEVLDQHTPDLLVIGNEPLNGPGTLNGSQTDPPTGYYIGPLLDYVLMVQTAYPIAKAHNVPMTCGGIGLNGAGMFGLTYRWLKTKYNQTAATSFGNNCMTSGQRTAANNPGTNQAFEYECLQQDTILSLAPYLDFINIHSYEVIDPDITNDADIVTNTTLVWKRMKEYVEERTERPCISNEIGQRGNTQPALVTAMINEGHRLGFKYFIWYSGTGPANPPAMPLHDMTWSGTGDPLLPNGTAFSNAPPVTSSSEQ